MAAGKNQKSQIKGNEFAVAKSGISVFTGGRSEVRFISSRRDMCLRSSIHSFIHLNISVKSHNISLTEHLFPSHVYFGEEKHLPWFSSDVLGDI